MEATDTFNAQMVGVSGDRIVVMMPKSAMTKAEALMHAAWLVALADNSGSPRRYDRHRSTISRRY